MGLRQIAEKKRSSRSEKRNQTMAGAQAHCCSGCCCKPTSRNLRKPRNNYQDDQLYEREQH
eukprot:1161001-Pelagomonas_calceolata.AAC.11